MTPNIPGAQPIADWFGRWPSFHDAEVMTFHIDREQSRSFIRIRVFTTSDRTDTRGRYIRDRDAMVSFEFAGIKSLHIEGEDADSQNVISGLLIEPVTDGYRLVLSPCYGVAGEMVVKELRVRLETTFQPESDC